MIKLFLRTAMFSICTDSGRNALSERLKKNKLKQNGLEDFLPLINRFTVILSK